MPKSNLQNRENYSQFTDEGSKRQNNLQSHFYAFNKTPFKAKMF